MVASQPKSPLWLKNNYEIPCLDTTNQCVEQLTQAAVSLRECCRTANSLTIHTLNERITLIDERLDLMGDRKDYAESKLLLLKKHRKQYIGLKF